MKIKTKSKKVNRAWLNDHVNDPYVKLAQKEGYRARAAYKLKDIDESLGLIKPGHLVVDLGSAPGAWSQYVRRKLSPAGAAAGKLNGTILALDLLPMEPVEGVSFIQGDFREPEVLAQLAAAMAGRKADVVVSDMAPNLSGIEAADTARIRTSPSTRSSSPAPSSPRSRASSRATSARSTRRSSRSRRWKPATSMPSRSSRRSSA